VAIQSTEPPRKKTAYFEALEKRKKRPTDAARACLGAEKKIGDGTKIVLSIAGADDPVDTLLEAMKEFKW
jgi:hypothetical protein